jgi:fumarate reductase subunit D
MGITEQRNPQRGTISYLTTLTIFGAILVLVSVVIPFIVFHKELEAGLRSEAWRFFATVVVMLFLSPISFRQDYTEGGPTRNSDVRAGDNKRKLSPMAISGFIIEFLLLVLTGFLIRYRASSTLVILTALAMLVPMSMLFVSLVLPLPKSPAGAETSTRASSYIGLLVMLFPTNISMLLAFLSLGAGILAIRFLRNITYFASGIAVSVSFYLLARHFLGRLVRKYDFRTKESS